MSKKYSRLTRAEREVLWCLKREKKSLRDIATVLKRSPSSLSRELQRNRRRGKRPDYVPEAAHHRAEKRQALSHRKSRFAGGPPLAYIVRQIRRGWSPERISGRAERIGLGRISHEAIYAWIYSEARHLTQFLPRSHPKRMPRGHRYRKQRASFIPSRKSISERPKIVERRKQAGHWEIDTMMGRHRRSALQLAVERKTGYASLKKLSAPKAAPMRKTLNRTLSRFPEKLRLTLTFDNGRENVEHLEMNEALGTKSYFCDPMQSWQKGTVENTAGLVRRRLPKKTDFCIVPEAEIRRTERWINGLPRKRLGYQTAAEAFRQAVALAR